MDLDYLDRRRRQELEHAFEARSEAARAAHQELAAASAARIASLAGMPGGSRAAA